MSLCLYEVYIVSERKPPPETPPTLDRMVRMIAGLGGFLNRKSDGFPGPQTLWIGLQRAADFVSQWRPSAMSGRGDMVNSQSKDVVNRGLCQGTGYLPSGIGLPILFPIRRDLARG